VHSAVSSPFGLIGKVNILSCVGMDAVMDFAVRIKGRITRERDEKVELDELVMVVEVGARRENEVYCRNDKHV
jgi:hypothetical protein